jgi:quinohemoprotein ethanol dehydrogenase
MIPAGGSGAPSVCCGTVNRGVALYGGKVFVGLLDGRLVALDRKTGTLVWSVMTTPPNTDYSITGAPRIVKGNVVIGNGGAEFGVRGFVSAYDAPRGRDVERRMVAYRRRGNGVGRDGLRSGARPPLHRYR